MATQSVPPTIAISLTSNVSTATTAATTISTTTLPTTVSTEYATVNYNGVIGINATDPYAFTTESRSFELPTQIQVSGFRSL